MRGIALTTFRDLGVLPETADALEAVGITEPFPIQAMTLPLALDGHDIIGQAKTGTGKTLGFGIPLLQRLTVPGDGNPQALVVVPTRELCVQVTSDLAIAGKLRDIRILAVYGGRSYEPQVEALRGGIDVVVGTPGRLLDLARQGHLELKEVQTLVLDEADEMLDLGFLPDVEKIVSLTSPDRQTMLFSATMPGEIITLARRYLKQPTHIRASDPDDTGATVRNTVQHVFRAHAMDKVEMLARLLQAEGRGLTMVFCRTKRTASKVADDLAERGFAAAAVHGDLGQGQREQALRAFRSGKIDVLVATDVAARGIDVEGVTHVVNYQCPEDEKPYLHRIGRTGRAGAAGIAVTFVDWDDMPRWSLINKALGLPFEDPAETYSTSDHFYEALDIPRTAKGVLPRVQRTREGLGAETVEDLGETGRRPRSDSSGGRKKSGDGGGRPARGAAADAAPKERPARRSRSRSRTRAGQPTDGAAAAVVSDGSAPHTSGGAEPAGEAGTGAPRRRRSRGGRGRSGGAAQSTPTAAE